ncbi:MAG: DoxX family protein [Candidatus Paracaedibacteraceae bacterium]|nr:DoxX family protein [Candidatus Paracaedibacteraceae bacterium]
MITLLQRSVQIYDAFVGFFIKYTQDLLLLLVRVYAASIFFQSGWNKLEKLWTSGWFKTVFLFKHVHPVPFLSPKLAAVLGTGAEIIFPILLALGVMTRIGALGLMGVTAVITFGVHHHFTHIFWALLLGVSFVIGPGRLSFDGWIRSKWDSLYAVVKTHLDTTPAMERKHPEITVNTKGNKKINLDNKIEPEVTTHIDKRKLRSEKDDLLEIERLLKPLKSSAKMKSTTKSAPKRRKKDSDPDKYVRA